MSRRTSIASSKRRESKQPSARSDMSDRKTKKTSPKVAQKRDGGGKGRSKNLVDIFNEHAMINAYYTCHNVQDLLKIRGFPWPELAKKKKKNKK